MEYLFFTTDNCYACIAAKNYLEVNNINVTTIQNENPELYAKHITSYPTLVVINDEGEELWRITGFSPSKYNLLKGEQ